VSATPSARRLLGAERHALAEILKQRYAAGESIRTIAKDIGRSYGCVHRLLIDVGTEFRSNGGDRRNPC
jgi:hypothetical protein